VPTHEELLIFTRQFCDCSIDGNVFVHWHHSELCYLGIMWIIFSCFKTPYVTIPPLLPDNNDAARTDGHHCIREKYW
jgi:hypothetical protein